MYAFLPRLTVDTKVQHIECALAERREAGSPGFICAPLTSRGYVFCLRTSFIDIYLVCFVSLFIRGLDVSRLDALSC